MDSTFTASQVATALRRFDDYGEDVLNSVYQTYANNLEIFLNHCESDPVMSTITAPLKENVNVNLDTWHKAFLAVARAFAGSTRFTLPSDEEDRQGQYGTLPSRVAPIPYKGCSTSLVSRRHLRLKLA
jgi:hypothetical protein